MAARTEPDFRRLGPVVNPCPHAMTDADWSLLKILFDKMKIMAGQSEKIE